MAGSVHIPWYATGFRGDKLEAAINEIAPVALRYGAKSYSVYRAYNDRYKFTQVADGIEKSQWEKYWDGPEFIRFRTLVSGWYQVPILYSWHDLTASGSLTAETASA